MTKRKKTYKYMGYKIIPRGKFREEGEWISYAYPYMTRFGSAETIKEAKEEIKRGIKRVLGTKRRRRRK